MKNKYRRNKKLCQGLSQLTGNSSDQMSRFTDCATATKGHLKCEK